MTLSEYIEHHLDGITAEWAGFADQQRPAAIGMTEEERRNLAREILQSIIREMRRRQSEAERHAKSRDERIDKPEEALSETARGHAGERLGQGFTVDQLTAEYRALRASVIRRWRSDTGAAGADAMEELTRFNEAVDKSMAEAVGWYHARNEEARDLLSGVLGHDLRTPMQAILASAEILLRDESLSPRQVRSIVRIRNSANRMRRMVNDLLDFTRTRLGTGLPLGFRTCNLETIVREICEEQRAFHPDAEITCRISGNVTAHWDRDRIGQMLANLIGNAIEHGRQTPVTVTAEGRGEEVVVEVNNEGGAIPPGDRRAVFDPLRRAVGSADEHEIADAGLGLGLYIARQIAEAHDGTIDLRSSDAAGTTFEVRLPKDPRGGTEA